MERKKYVDYIKAICILLVIVGHVNFANDLIKDWIYAFHMPAFFFATGLTFNKQALNREYVKKKISTLIVPYLIWGMIYSKMSLKNMLYIIYGSYATIIRADSLSSLWFIPALFCGILLAQFLLWVSDKTIFVVLWIIISLSIAKALPIISVGYPWCIDVSFLSTCFILLGYILRKYVEAMKKSSCVCVCLIGVVLTLIYHANTVTDNGYVLVANRNIGNPILFMISSIGGCLFVCGMARLLELSFIKNAILSYIGKSTLLIFAIHKPVIRMFELIFFNTQLSKIVVLIATTVGTLVITCIGAMVIQSFIPNLAGKR